MPSSTGLYHRRWGAGSNNSAAAAGSNLRSLSSTVEPHMYGTSWNSVRWNKPVFGDERRGGHLSRLTKAFDSAASKPFGTAMLSSTSGRPNLARFSTSSQSPSSKRFTIDTGNTGPSVLERSSRFGGSSLSSTSGSNRSKDNAFSAYRSPSQRSAWAPDPAPRRSTLANTYLSSRNSTNDSGSLGSNRGSSLYNASSRYSSSLEKGRSAAGTSRTSSLYESYPKRTISSPAPSSSIRERYTTRSPTIERRNRTSTRAFESSYPRAIEHSPTSKLERPWRQRLNEAARLRNLIDGENYNNNNNDNNTDTGGMHSSNISPSSYHYSQRYSNNSLSHQNSTEDLRSSRNSLNRSFLDNSTLGSLRNRLGSRNSSLDISSVGNSSAFRGTTYPLATKYGASNFSSYNSWRQGLAKNREPMLSRSYSPVRPQESLYTTLAARYGSFSRDVSPRIRRLMAQQQPSIESSLLNVYTPKNYSLETINNKSRDSSVGLESVRKRLSARERTARHNSRQKSQSTEPASDSESSSGAEERAESRERRLRKRRLRRKATRSPSYVSVNSEKRGIPDGALIESAEAVELKLSIMENLAVDRDESPVKSNIHSPLLAPQFVAAAVSTASEHEYQPASPELEEEENSIASDSEPHKEVVSERIEETQSVKEEVEEIGNDEMGLKGSKNEKEGVEEIPGQESIAPKNESTENEGSKDGAEQVQKLSASATELKAEANETAMECANVRQAQQPSEAFENPSDAFQKATDRSVSPEIEPLKEAKPSKEREQPAGGDKGDAIEVKSDREEYSAIACFHPGERKKLRKAPVPGTWIGPKCDEMNISQIRSIEKPIVNVSTTVHLVCTGNSPSNTAKVMTILKTFSFCEAPALRIRLPKVKKKVLKEISVDESLKAVELGEGVVFTNECRSESCVSKKVRVPPSSTKKRPPEPIESSTAVELKIASKKAEQQSETAQTRFKTKAKLFASCCFTTKQPSTSVAAIQQALTKKDYAMSGAAQISIVSSPIVGQNYYRCRRRLRATPSKPKRQSMPSLPTIINDQTLIIEEEKSRLDQTVCDLDAQKTSQHQLDSRQRSESLASVVLDQLRKSDEPVPIWRRRTSATQLTNDEDSKKHLVLPDRSVLEEYVNRRANKNRFERLHSEPPIVESEESLRCSPCLSTVSELVPASAVRVYESTRNLPLITAPNRSRLNSAEPTSKTPPEPPKRDNSKMLDLLSYGEQMLAASYQGLKPSQLNRSQRAQSLTIKPTFVFDVPRSPFEDRMQKQAHSLRNSSNASANSQLSESDVQAVDDISSVDVTMQLPARPRNRHSSADNISVCSGGTITSNFEAAAAAAQHPRHERYAAHLPVKGAEVSSGRLSSTSVDSTNSGGVLDTAGKQVDQMIDQARFRHHQNRSKFKEAIDYLDQIFEDLKKECDQTPSQDSVSRPSRPHPANGVSPASKTPVTPLSQKATPTGSIGGGNASNKNAITPVRPEPRPRLTRSTQQQQQDTSKQSPISRIAADPSAGMQKSPRPQPTRTKPTVLKQSPPQEKFEQTFGDVDVAETIVLPSPDRKLRGDRLDFTRKWLAGDIKSWASGQPKPDLLLGGLEEEPMDYDLDERSIGSCSAEVAAINSMDRKKRRQRETPDLLQDAVVPPAKPARKSINTQPPPQQQKFDNAPVQPVPIKPQPLRPHPVYGLATSSKAYNFNNHYPQPFREISERVNSEGHLNGGIQHSFKKVASHNQISDRKRSNEAAAPQWRASSQETCNTLSSVRSDDNAVIHRNGAFAQYTPNNSAMRASVNSLPESSTQLLGKTVAKQPDPVLAIDALVAELELNTDEPNFTDKRRSFPTRLEASSSNRLPEFEKSKNNQPITNGSSKLAKTSSVDRGVRRVKQQKMAFDEMTNMLRNVAGDIGAEDSSPRFRRSDQLRPTSGTSGTAQVLSPFETINQEKLNPSKVEAMQSVFENKHDIAPPAWRRNMWHGRRASKEDENYCEINEFSNAQKEVSSPSGYSHIKPQSPSSKTKFSSVSQPPPVNVTAQQQQQQQHHRNQHHPNTTHSSTINSSVISSSQPSYRAASNSLSRESISSIPAFPVTQPPSQPPGSTNSSQTGGYYSSGSSLGAQSSYATSTNQSSSLQRSSGSGHRGSLNGKQSMCSRPTSVGDDDEDDGFYDNIQIDERRFSSATETDNTSMSSHRLPPSNNATAKGRSAASGASSTNRFGQFLRKISGSSKPPMNAASLLSLNKVSDEKTTGHAPLMKSNSLSNEPWKAQVIGKNQNSSTPQRRGSEKRAGLGQRLKNSIFGSKKRLN